MRTAAGRLLDRVISAVLGHRQVTDTYLLALAVARAGALVTLDSNVDLATVTGATVAHLVVV